MAHRGRQGSRVAVPVLGVLTVLIIAALVPASGLARQNPLANAGTGLMLGVPFAGVGLVVTRRQPRNPIGWLSLGFAVCFLLSIDAGFYLVAAYRLGRHLPLAPVMLFLQPLWELALATLPLVILMFPEGRLPSRRWRPALWLYALLCAGFVATAYLQASDAIAEHRIRIDSGGDLTTAVHGTGPTSSIGGVAFALLALLTLSFVGRQVLSWVRSAGERRQQVKWLMFGAIATVASVAVSTAVGNATGIWQDVSNVLTFGLVAMPVAIGVGIMKYRLYDIDRIISRTLAYALVTGLLVGVYAALVLLATQVLRFHTAVAVAAATLAAAALFSPLRRRVQRVVDRRFNRARYDADLTVAVFAARLKDAVDLDSVRDDLAQVVSRALEPAHLSLWISHGD
jgi:hypothetical protein